MIWECRHCRDRVRGPRAPGERHECRVCLPCTLRMGEFVQRHPRKRAGKVAKANPRLGRLWRGLDLQRELRRLLRFCPDTLRDKPPRLVLLHCSMQPDSGNIAFADPSTHEIQIRLWPSCPAAWALGSLIHELAHFCVAGLRHGDAWRQAMLGLLRDGYGLDADFPTNRSSQALDHAV